ncbi:alkaline phosphatase family protein [Lapillicoccus jejuensis]|uniref:Putative AlkP superfamily pyrophosphatase or phosphodiesterase n=1 Tax=Lapillicoccus jejuensis TaxID=402171 RepID=A0A542E5P0_9MICO|nr:nucleotide pyrophosphatase/phosphodiesterase family protein [Lapillicoccus jejuensis]TQJ10594.1 putative AlkP superfamily pyrophosphatase or phosphodiesterase [Lapillicoccus jejuensis]
MRPLEPVAAGDPDDPSTAASSLPPPPDYAGGTLASVLPAVAASLGATSYGDADPFGLVPARRAVVVLVDGLGLELLRRRGGHAPFLRSHLPGAVRLDSGYPSTTATSMGSFGTGLPPGAHGLVGYEVLVPGEDRTVNELSWEGGPDPRTWQPAPTVFQRLEADDVRVTRIGPAYFDGSGLTEAALRGGRFVAARHLPERVEAALTAVRASSRSLVYLYWGDLDKVGHVHGCGSWEWGDELEAVDGALAELARRVPSDTAVYVTADHGMVDAPHALRLDLAHDEELSRGVRHLGGEPRSPQLYAEPGAAGDVLATWRERLAPRAWVLSREEAVAAGWFGPVREDVLPRVGDVVVLMRESFAVVHSRRTRPEVLALLGLHGSVTADERSIPLVRIPPRTA